MKKGILIVLALFVFTSCEDKEDDKVFKAQACLDRATPATVDTCVDAIAGIGTPQAYVIRCSADFLRGGITTSTIVTAVENMDDNGTTTDPTLALYDAFAVMTEDAAEDAVANCTATGSTNLIVLALLAQNSAILKRLATAATQLTIAAWIASLNSGSIAAIPADDLAAVGNSIIFLYPTACGEGGQFEGTQECTNIANSIGQSTPEEIAKKYLEQLQN